MPRRTKEHGIFAIPGEYRCLHQASRNVGLEELSIPFLMSRPHKLTGVFSGDDGGNTRFD